MMTGGELPPGFIELGYIFGNYPTEFRTPIASAKHEDDLNPIFPLPPLLGGGLRLLSAKDFDAISEIVSALSPSGSSSLKMSRKRKAPAISFNEKILTLLPSSSSITTATATATPSYLGLQDDQAPPTPPTTPPKKKKITPRQELETLLLPSSDEDKRSDHAKLTNMKLVCTTSTKINYLLQQLLQHSGDKIVVFSQYPNTIYHICEALKIANIRHAAYHTKIVSNINRSYLS
jgi:hypothetical protein